MERLCGTSMCQILSIMGEILFNSPCPSHSRAKPKSPLLYVANWLLQPPDFYASRVTVSTVCSRGSTSSHCENHRGHSAEKLRPQQVIGAVIRNRSWVFVKVVIVQNISGSELQASRDLSRVQSWRQQASVGFLLMLHYSLSHL